MSEQQSSAANDCGDQPLLSLCMIVRDVEHTLEPCLVSIRPWVDELIVVDTGSVDQTPAIAERLGARVFHFPWCDDFAAARNVSLECARGQWLFWMDADDTIDEANGRKLRKLVDGGHREDIYGYVMRVHCPASASPEDFTAVDHVKLFRNLPKLRFEGRIHEQILPAIRRAGGDVGWTDIFVTHSGSDQSPDGRRKKYERDLRILHLDHQERPEHPFVLFNLGMTYADMGRHDEAVGWLRRSIAQAQPTESHLRKAYALLAGCLHQLERPAEAEGVCSQGLAIAPDDPELLFRRAMLAHEAGQLTAAAEAYQRVLSPSGTRYFASLDQGVTGAKAHHNLACVYLDLGRPDLAEIHWRQVLKGRSNLSVHRQLIETLIQQQRHTAAKLELTLLEKIRPRSCECLLLHARLAESQDQLHLAREHLQSAVKRHPDEATAWEALGRFHFLHSDPSDAAQALVELVRLEPENGAALHNLGIAQLRSGETAAAVASLERSLHIRPESLSTRAQLEQAKATLESIVASEY